MTSNTSAQKAAIKDSINESSQAVAEPSKGKRKSVKAIQDLLLSEGLLAAKLSVESSSIDQLQDALIGRFSQNSQETRKRYAQSVLKWFFPNGINGLVRRSWLAYGDESIQLDLLRYLYLNSEPLMGACVTEALFPLEEGMLIPPNYFDRFLNDYLNEAPPPKTRERLKSNLMRLGFLSRARGKPDRLTPVTPTKTGFLILLHYLFAADGPRTIELRRLFANPFWKYLGFKSEDAVRRVLREADAAGLLGKYVVADQLEQITTRMTLDELFGAKAQL